MTRALLVIVIGVCALCVPTRTTAQAPPVSPDGWVVLPVDEYKALRERANPKPPQPAPPPVDATLTRIDYDLRIDNDTVRAGPAHDRRDARRLDTRADPRGIDGARRETRWTTGLAG
jgi:hypothetical protein